MIRGFGRDVPKDTSKQMLGELEIERDLEREEERLEAEAEEIREAEAADLERRIEYFLEEFQEEIYQQDNGYDDDSRSMPSHEQIVEIVRVWAERAWHERLDGAIPKMGVTAMWSVLRDHPKQTAESFNFRTQLRALNEIARMCGLASIPEQDPNWGYQLDLPNSPVWQLRDALKNPLESFARMNQDFSLDDDRTKSPLFSERDIDTLGAHVTVVSLLRQSLRDVSTDDQRQAVGQTIISLLRSSFYDFDQGPHVVTSENVQSLHSLRKAFPSAKSEIISKVREKWNGGYEMSNWQFQQNPLGELSNFRLARQFAREAGVEVDWKKSLSELLTRIEEIPAIDHGVSKDDPSFADSQFATVRKLVGDAWEFLPASIISASPAVRKLLRGEDGLTESRLKNFADATGVDWVPGERWPNEPDVRALFADALDNLDMSSDKIPFARVDEIERVTGWDRMPFLTEDILETFRSTFEVWDDSLPEKPKLLEQLLNLYSTRGIALAKVAVARIVCGPEAFEIHRRAGLSAEGAYSMLLRHGRSGGNHRIESIGARTDVFRAFATANGLTPAQEEYLQNEDYLPLADRIFRARELRLTEPTVTETVFIDAIKDNSAGRLVSALGTKLFSELAERVSKSLALVDYISLAEILRKERLPVPRITVAQISAAIKNRVLKEIEPFISKSDMRAYLDVSESALNGHELVVLYALAKRLKMPVPEITHDQLQDALSYRIGDEIIELIGKKRFETMIRERVANDPFCPYTFFVAAAQVANRNNIPGPAITDRLFQEAVQRKSLVDLLPIVPRATLEKGCAIFPAGDDPDGYIARLKFSKENGLPCPEMTPELFSRAMQLERASEMFSILEPRLLSDLLAACPLYSVGGSSWRQLVVEHLPALKAAYALNPKAHQRGIVGMLLRLYYIQPPSRNTANDPWVSEIEKIAKTALVSSPEDADQLVDYVQSFGLVCAPELIRIHDRVFKARTVANVDASSRRTLESVGVTFPAAAELARRPDLSVRALLEQLKAIIAAIPSRLLVGERVEGLDTGIGNELFKVLLGETRWGQHDSVAGMQKLLAEAERKNPESAKVPSAFHESEFSIKETSRSADRSADERMAEFLSSREVRERFGALAGGWANGLDVTRGNDRLEKIRETIRDMFEESLRRLRIALESDDAAFADYLAPLGPEQKAAEQRLRTVAGEARGRAGLEKQAARIRELIAEIASVDVGAVGEQGLVEWISANASRMSSSAEWLRELSARDMARLMPEGMRQAVEIAVSERDSPTLGSLDKLAGVQRQYVREHYLNAEQRPDHTGHPPYSKAAVWALEKAWQLGETKANRLPIEEAFEKGTKISRGKEAAEESVVSVRMIPVVGLLRVYAGEIGDACYSSHHVALANGTYPNLQAWVYGTTDENDHLTLRGSVLALNVQTTDGVPTLVVRANNPKENFIRGLDAPAFVRATLLEGVATARRQWAERAAAGKRGPAIVAVPFDPATASCTNRHPIANDYHRRFSKNQKLSLMTSNETTFKYDLTRAEGKHPCVNIWQIDANGQETWTGNWE